MELEREFKLGTQQVIGLYNELTDFLDMNRNSMGSRDYPSIRVFIEDLEEAVQPPEKSSKESDGRIPIREQRTLKCSN